MRVEPKKLVAGPDSPKSTAAETEARIAVLQATVKHHLPEFVAAVKKLGRELPSQRTLLMLHQDAFAAGYHDDEYMLLGMAIKYAGLHGVGVHITGKNGATCR